MHQVALVCDVNTNESDLQSLLTVPVTEVCQRASIVSLGVGFVCSFMCEARVVDVLLYLPAVYVFMFFCVTMSCSSVTALNRYAHARRKNKRASFFKLRSNPNSSRERSFNMILSLPCCDCP